MALLKVVVRHFIFCLLVLCFVSPLAVASSAKDAAQALHLLGYLAADYPPTVAQGKVIDPGEYKEQLEFSSLLQELIAKLPEKKGHIHLITGSTQLSEKIKQRVDGKEVTSLARDLAGELATVYQVSRAPSVAPNPAKAKEIYTQNCSSCHGKTGAGDGPAGVSLIPKPADLRDKSRMDAMSLYGLYNTITLGVSGTGMVGFANILDEQQRWNLASYIARFTATKVSGSSHYTLEDLAGKVPSDIQNKQGESAANIFKAQRANPASVIKNIKKPSTSQLIQRSVRLLDQSLKEYQSGNTKKAYQLSITAYLEGFELVENPLDNIDSDLRKSTEKTLMAYRQGIQNEIPASSLSDLLDSAKVALKNADARLNEKGLSPWLAFISSLLILLREGLEAVLVLAAIFSFLQKTEQTKSIRSVHAGWITALVAGVATWALAAYLLDVSGAQRELLEGFTSLFACVMVLWLGVWMHNRRHADAWKSHLQASLVGRSSGFGFALLAFFSVYRELFEVILFYETLWLQAGPKGHHMVLIGALVAVVLLVGLTITILRSSRKLPLTTFFTANAILLCALSVIFAGQGISALQEAGVIHSASINFFEFSWLGIYPDAYSLGAQILVLSVITFFYYRSLRDKKLIE